jgi:peptidoglycan/LPS O-acetylase OafA/YrhL
MLLAWVLLVFVRPEWTMSAWAYAFSQPVATALFLVPITELSYRYVELPWNRVGPMVAGWITESYTANTVDLASAWRANRQAPEAQVERER